MQILLITIRRVSHIHPQPLLMLPLGPFFVNFSSQSLYYLKSAVLTCFNLKTGGVAGEMESSSINGTALRNRYINDSKCRGVSREFGAQAVKTWGP